MDALKYTGFKEYVTERVSIRSYNPLLTLQDIISYLRFQSMYPVIEQLCKRGFSTTLTDEIHQGGTMVKEGTVRIVDKVQIFIQEQYLFPLLRRVQVFIETMTAQAMQKYYEKVSEPMLQVYDTQE